MERQQSRAPSSLVPVVAGGPRCEHVRAINRYSEAVTRSVAPPVLARQPELIPVGDLHFDPRNPRLVDHGSAQRELVRTLWRDFNVREVALSIAANGFWDYEPLVVAREDNILIVIEGNRRLAAVKLLLDGELRKTVGATDLPPISEVQAAGLMTLPAILAERDESWRFIGFKHVNGPQAWQSYSKAQYIAWVHETLGISLDSIADTIGDEHSTVLRLYRALATLQQAERKGIWKREDRFKEHFSFSHLMVGLNSYTGIQQHLGLEGPPAESTDPVPDDHLDNLRELLVWLYGSKSETTPPLVQSQNPDLRRLSTVIQNKNSLAAVRAGMSLSIAVDVAKGDSAKLREDLVAARRLIQDSRGKVITGYEGDRDLLDVALDIVELANAIYSDMETSRRKPKRRTAR